MIRLTAIEFLREVWPLPLVTNETLEMRVINRKTQKISREFCYSLEEFIKAIDKHRDKEIYFGVSTRYKDDGTKLGCYRTKAVWIDLDSHKIEDCRSFDPEPSLLVKSGKGVHVYWLLKTTALVREERWKAVEAVNRSLTHRFHGDIAAIDISRILRVPDTLNHKYKPAVTVEAYKL